MYRIRDELGRPHGQADTADQAEAALDALCEQAHAQAVRSGEGTSDQWHRFEVLDELDQVVMFRQYNPDPAAPYIPLNRQDET